MSVFERPEIRSRWQERKPAIPVVVGKAGLAWGHGMTAVFDPPQKREGDNKSPAGIFRLRGVFGYAPLGDTSMPYVHVTADTVCVDDAESRHYNQFVYQSRVRKHDWRSAEEMSRKDDLYKWGVVLDYNTTHKRAAGSCIFLHIWRGPDAPTVGCTAMSERNLVGLIRWLDPMCAPMLVQLPRPIYDQYREKWNLPPLR